MARTAKYSPVNASLFTGEYRDVTVERGTAKTTVSVPVFKSLNEALSYFGNVAGPSDSVQDDEDNELPKTPSLVDFVQDAVNSFHRSKAYQSLIPVEDKIKGIVTRMVKAGIPEAAAREFATAQLKKEDSEDSEA